MVEALESRAGVLLELLGERIDNFYFDSILVDLESGRVPAGVMWWAMHGLYGDKKILGRFFVRGGKMLKNLESHRRLTREYLHRVGPIFGPRVLLVTEEILTGESEEMIAEMLGEAGVETEIAAFGVDYDEYDRVVYGSGVNTTPAGIRLYLANWEVPLSLFGDLGRADNMRFDLWAQVEMGRHLAEKYRRERQAK